MTARLIVFVPPVAGLPAPWRVVGPDGQVLERGLLEPNSSLPGQMPVTAIVPGAEVAVRWLDLPRGREAQLAAAARWQMAERLGHDLTGDQVVIGQRKIVGRGSVQGAVPVAVVAQGMLAAWRTWLDGAGIADATLAPDSLCLVPDDEGLVQAALPYGDVIVSGLSLSLTLQPDLADLVVAGQPTCVVQPDEVLDRLAQGCLSSPLDLVASARTAPRRGWRRPAILALAVIVSPLVLVWAETLRDNLAARRVLDGAERAAIAFQPSAAGVADPLRQVEVALAEAPSEGGQTRSLAGLVTAMDQVPGVILSEVDGARREMRGVLVLPSSDTVEPLRQALMIQDLSLDQCELSQEAGRTLCAFVIRDLS